MSNVIFNVDNRNYKIDYESIIKSYEWILFSRTKVGDVRVIGGFLYFCRWVNWDEKFFQFTITWYPFDHTVTKEQIKKVFLDGI